MGKWRKAPEELVELFTTTMGEFKQADQRKMFGYPCCFVNGNMFTGLHQESWVVRLNEQDREAIQCDFQAKPFEPMAGRVMREYVGLPDVILNDNKQLKAWIKKSLEFAASLPAKPKKS